MVVPMNRNAMRKVVIGYPDLTFYARKYIRIGRSEYY